jgi:ATP-binding cassette subfamily F protein 3
VALAVLTLQGANFLLLDEPTNHLDLQSQEVLQAVLSDFAGTVLLVSHDRYLVDHLATHLWVIQDRTLVVQEGGYTQYVTQKRERELKAKERDKPDDAPSDKERKRLEKEKREQDALRKAKREKEKRLADLEAGIASLEERLRALTHELEAAGVSGAVARVHELGREYADVEGQLYDRMAEWSEAAG